MWADYVGLVNNITLEPDLCRLISTNRTLEMSNNLYLGFNHRERPLHMLE